MQAVMVTLRALLMECASAGMEADGSEMSVRGLQQGNRSVSTCMWQNKRQG